MFSYESHLHREEQVFKKIVHHKGSQGQSLDFFAARKNQMHKHQRNSEFDS